MTVNPQSATTRYFVGPVVKIAFERPNIFVGKTIGLTVDRIDINQFVEEIRDTFKDDSEYGWRYERVINTLLIV